METLKTGTDVDISTDVIDNSLVIYLNPDNMGVAGWAKVFEFSSGGLGAPNSKGQVSLRSLLETLKGRGVKTVDLSAVGTNFTGGGTIEFRIKYPNKEKVMEKVVEENLPEWTSKQWAFRLEL